MYDIIYNIIGHAYVSNDPMQQYILDCCVALIILLTVFFADMVYRVFRHFWRG